MYRRSFFFPGSPHTQRRKMGATVLPSEEEEEEEEEGRKNRFSINDNVDLLVEVLGRLDGRSLGVAACVCRLWSGVCRRDSVWEALCNRHVAGGGGGPGTRSVVAALGGYRRLYRFCVGPALDRLSGGPGRSGWASAATAAHLSLALPLSLFSIDCYERLGGHQASLLFLCKPVNVS
ncbi:F-box protein SNE [Elaeis guineensis]|uniref:F-box protein SNE n=1 Tax=Elaeis guineensis var. tenera TaxID=51953 RepID=A0A6I9QGC2_ELAGV|nr:F-box protein SNE [Elaeis guineensis]